MGSPRLISATVLLVTILGCASASPRTPSPPQASPPPDVPSINRDAGTIATVAAGVAPAAPPSVSTLPVIRRADTSPRWTRAASMSAVGSRAALSARLWAEVQRRLAAMGPEDRRNALELHREMLRESRLPRARVSEAAAGSLGDMAAPAASPAQPTSSASQGAAQPASITNNQVANVDEGDIVKASGDDLIILRRGSLIRVSLANGATRRVAHTPAYPPNTPPGDWYDELLVDGDIALVLGYSYRADATEVNRFRLARDGSIRYLDTFYLRSEDYFSSENYATRLVNGRLVLYVPAPLVNDDLWDRRLTLPRVRLGRAGPYRAPYDYTRVYATDLDHRATTLHTVLQCDVRAPRVSCDARGVLGGESRTFYVSPTAVYVWTEVEADDGDRGAWIVRLPLNGAQPPGAARVRGGPTDQFAFDERDGDLHVLLREEGHGEAMGAGRDAGGVVTALRVPLAQLVGQVSDAPPEAYTQLATLPGRGQFRNRWVGDHCLFGTGRNPYAAATDDSDGVLFAYRAATQALFAVRPGHGVERIEPLGRHALAVGNAGATLSLTPVALDGAAPELFAPLRLPQRAQGETRSHGFFFRPSGARDGVFGLATAGHRRPGALQLVGASDVSFFRVSQLALTSAGTVTARPAAQDRCAVSCLDWYGNTRPIFWGERVLALMGDELVEVLLGGADGLAERSRLDFGEGVRSAGAEE